MVDRGEGTRYYTMRVAAIEMGRRFNEFFCGFVCVDF